MCRAKPIALRCLLASGALVIAGGCTQDMADQPRFEPLEASSFFADGMASRPLVDGTVARGHLRVDAAFYAGKVDGKLVEQVPVAAIAERLDLSGEPQQQTLRILERGRERFDIFCSPCHGRIGAGDGMVVERGFPKPPSLHIERLREAPPGHFYDVIARGFGRMSSYADAVPPADRWAIVAYVRALQLSQHAELDALPEQDRKRLERQEAAP